MDRRTFLCCLTLGTLSVPLAAEAQPSQAGPRKIGVLWDVKIAPPRFVPLLDWLLEDLKDQGFAEKDLQLVIRHVEGQKAVQDAARDLINERVTVIWTSDALPALAAKAETREIPIVFGAATNPLRYGLVESFAKPGGNVTGVAVHDHVPGKRLEILKEMVPRLRRVLVTPDPTIPLTPFWLQEVREAASKLGITLAEQPFTSKNDIERLPEILKRERVDGVLHLVSPTANQHWEAVQEAIQAAHVPDISYYLPGVERRLVMAAYGANYREVWRTSARLLGKILRGVKPQDLPVESPGGIELHINLGMAKERRVQIPQEILFRAHKVFH